MQERAIVKQVLNGQVIVESLVKSTCSQCQQVDTCGSGQVAKALPHKTLSLAINTPDAYKVGDEVIIAIPEQALLSVAWQVYLLPILGLIIAGGLGQYLFTQAHLVTAEWQAIFMALAGGIGGHKLAKWRQKDSKQNKALAPQILQRVIATKPA